MQVFMEMFERSGTPSQSVNLEVGDQKNSKEQSKEVLRSHLGRTNLLGFCGHSPLTLRWLESNLENAQTLQWRFLVLVLYFFDITGRNFGQIAFCNNPFSGLIFIIGIFIASPVVAAAGLVASTVSLVFALATNHPREGIISGCSGFNAVLYGLIMKSIVLVGDENSAGEFTEWIIIVVGAAVTVALTNSLGSMLGSLTPAVPCLSLPFNLTAVAATLMLTFRNEQPGAFVSQEPELVESIDHANFSFNHTVADLEASDELNYAFLLQGSVLGVAQVIAVNDFACSAFVVVGMLLSSPLLTIMAYLGSLLSTCLAAMLTSSLHEFAYNGLMGYNGFLTACAIMYFFVPSRKSALLAIVSIVATLAVQVGLSWAFNDISLPIFSLPFVGVGLGVLGARGLPRPATLTFPEHHIAQWRESAALLPPPLASLSLASVSQQSLRSSTVTENRWRRTPSL